ncbi:MAG: phosphate ABC transporter permease family protein, partial [Chromatiaceae bacterium]|nr:phosphate ABC transporter permease family protein [Chromatiaceae bacterium]
MQDWILTLVLLAAMTMAYQVGRRRAIAGAGGAANIHSLHSLPGYYGFYAALWAGLPAFLLFAAWVGLQDQIVLMLLKSQLPPAMLDGLSDGRIGLLINDIKNLASGNIVSSDITPQLQAAADQYNRMSRLGTWSMWVAVLTFALGGMWYAWSRTKPSMKARNRVESIVMTIMVIFSSIAILTTLGIVLSVLF